LNTITGGAGADELSGDAGDDTFNFASAAELAADVTVDGGADTDIIVFSTADQTVLDTDFANVSLMEGLTFNSGTNSVILAAAAANAFANLTVTGGSGTDSIDLDNIGWNESITVVGAGGNDVIQLNTIFVANNDVVELGTVALAGMDDVTGFLATGAADKFKFVTGDVYSGVGVVAGANITEAQANAIAASLGAWDTTGDAIGFIWNANNYIMINGNNDATFSNNDDAIVEVGDLTGYGAANFIA